MDLSSLTIPGWDYTYLPETGSTNDEAFRLGPGHVVAAGRQTAARGRLGRVYSAEEGGLWFSVALRPDCAPAQLTPLPALAAVAVREALGDKTMIKWPNDIFLDGKKICGILSELRDGVVVLGIGINLTNALPPELTEAGRAQADAGELLLAIMRRLDDILAGYPANADSLMPRYSQHCLTLGKYVDCVYRGMPLHGFACGVDNSGGLMVMTQESRTVVILYSGEATLSLPDEDED